MAKAFHHYKPPEWGLVRFVLSNLFPTRAEKESGDEVSGSKNAEVVKEATVNGDSTKVQQPDVKVFAGKGQGKNICA